MYEQSETELLGLLAQRAGIAAEYHDMSGTQHVTSDETRRALLEGMGFRVYDRAALIEELTAWDNQPWLGSCETVRIVRFGQDPGAWSLHLPAEPPDDAGVRVHWLIRLEAGDKCHEREEGPGLVVQDSRVIDGRRYIRL